MAYTPRLINPGGWYAPNDYTIASDPDSVPNFPSFDATYKIPQLQSRTIVPYPNVTARDADITPSPGDTWWAWTIAEQILWVYSNGWHPAYAEPTPWTRYVPVWRDGNGTGLNIANGTLYGRYQIFGANIQLGFLLIRGSNTNIGASGGPGYAWSLPAGVQFKDYNLVTGAGTVRANGGNSSIPCTVEAINATQFCLNNAATGGRIGTTNPGNWVASDIIKAGIVGEIVI